MDEINISSDSDDDDFDSLFTVSKTNITEQLARKEKHDCLIGETSDKLACPEIDLLKRSPTKKSRVVKPSLVPEISPIVILDDEIEQPTRGCGRGRGRGRWPVRATRRRNQGVSASVDLEIPSPEFVTSISRGLNWSLDDSIKDVSIDLEEDNYEISVKVCWKSKTVTPFMIRKYQKLSSIFEFYAKQEGVTLNQLQLTLGDRIVSPDDSPDSLSLTVINILEGGILTSAASTMATTATTRAPSPVDEGSIQLKVRAKDSKQPVLIRIKKTQKMLVLMTKYSEQCEIPIEKLKFSFDGELINPTETPEDLDLEGGEIIDLFIKT